MAEWTPSCLHRGRKAPRSHQEDLHLSIHDMFALCQRKLSSPVQLLGGLRRRSVNKLFGLTCFTLGGELRRGGQRDLSFESKIEERLSHWSHTNNRATRETLTFMRGKNRTRMQRATSCSGDLKKLPAPTSHKHTVGCSPWALTPQEQEIQASTRG